MGKHVDGFEKLFIVFCLSALIMMGVVAIYSIHKELECQKTAHTYEELLVCKL